jgi:sterol O-acyltransferase
LNLSLIDLGFYGFLHCWLNAFAEMLRFADRMFYKVEKYLVKMIINDLDIQDWWNSRSFAAYYRTWNVVVHDWLYTYVYKEIYVVRYLFCRFLLFYRFVYLLVNW